jgi:RHS repeat protein/IPT/TIG domain-containing protein
MQARSRQLVLGLAVVLAVPTASPGQLVHYAYDAAGRLSVVADARGDLAVYQYDAVGNLLSIQRIDVGDVPDAVFIAHVSPGVGPRGATVSLFGKGFAAVTSANAVTFNDVPAEVLIASSTRLTVRVPPSATTGPIRLSTPLGSATSPVFHVLGVLSVTPSSAVVAPGGSVRFSAVGNDASSVRWSVDRVVGGDSERGTIGLDGVYVAPKTLAPTGVRVTATSVIDPTVEATAHVSMVASRPFFVAAESISIGVLTNAGFAMAAPLALRVAPVILIVTPSAAARAETTRLSITGTGFEGATRLEFWTSAGPDAAVAATGLMISADGHQATADVAVAHDAAAGPRVVRIFTPAGASGDAVPGENVLLIR